jgi:hypothetical protein
MRSAGQIDINVNIQLEVDVDDDCIISVLAADGQVLFEAEVMSDIESGLERLVCKALENCFEGSLAPNKIVIV